VVYTGWWLEGNVRRLVVLVTGWGIRKRVVRGGAGGRSRKEGGRVERGNGRAGGGEEGGTGS